MKAIEKTILKAARSAAKKYSAMADGAWLSEGPEHFLQNEVAQAVWRESKKNWVLIDLSNGKINKWIEDKLCLPRDVRKRPDIYVVDHSWDHPIAVIEVKTKGDLNNVLKDAKKIKDSFKYHGAPGYLLVCRDGFKYLNKGTKSQKRKAAERHRDGQFSKLRKMLRKSDPRWSCISKKCGGTTGGETTDAEVSQTPLKKRNHARGTTYAWGVRLYRFS
jgi:hypothetical protein